MACPVYCLVPHPEQLDPLVERLRRAGVRSRDILVVQRDEEAAPLPAPLEACLFVHSLWNLQLAPAAWWWPGALRETGDDGAQHEASSGGRHEVISLARYRARRAGTARG